MHPPPSCQDLFWNIFAAAGALRSDEREMFTVCAIWCMLQASVCHIRHTQLLVACQKFLNFLSFFRPNPGLNTPPVATIRLPHVAHARPAAAPRLPPATLAAKKGPPARRNLGVAWQPLGALQRPGTAGMTETVAGCSQCGYYDVIDRGRHLVPFGARPGYGHGPALRFRLW